MVCLDRRIIMNNKIINQIKKLMNESVKKYLPNIKEEDLEENGAIYYMNSNMGTMNDWHSNNRLSDFMIFYNNKKKLGAIKLILYRNGTINVFVYDNDGKNLIRDIKSKIDDSEEDILKLAVILYMETDMKSEFDINIDNINFDISVPENVINNFKEGKETSYESFNGILDQMAFVTKRITEENWNVGLMYREDNDKSNDSGWRFLSPIDSQDYIDNINNLDYIKLGNIAKLDPVILKYIDMPSDTHLVRISKNEFKIDDDSNTEIFKSKRNE